MDELEVQECELLDEVRSLKFSPPPMKKSDTRDSISSIDSDVSLSFDRRGSKGEEAADADLSDSGSSELEIIEDSLLTPMNRSQGKSQSRHRSRKNSTSADVESEINGTLVKSVEIPDSDRVDLETVEILEESTFVTEKELVLTGNGISSRKTTDEEDEEELPQCSDELAEKICDQVEFYFSDENIVKDAFLLKHVKRNKEGYVSLKLISSFKKVKHLSRDWRVVGTALRKKSTKLEVNEQGTKLRRRDPLPPYDQTMPSRTVLAARLPVEKLTIESVAELFRQCGEIVLVRVLRPGNPTPTEVRQAIAKRPELANSEECALIEFADSAAARIAMRMSLGEARIYELQQSSNVDKKRKQVAQKQQMQQQQQQQQPIIVTKKNNYTRVTRDSAHNSSSCASGSEAEDPRISRNGRHPRAHALCHHMAFTPPPGHPFPASPAQEAWLTRRLSSCSISSGMESSGSGIILRRLSSCSGSGSSSDTGSYPSRRFSSCSSGVENNCVPPGVYEHHLAHGGPQNPGALYPTGYYSQGRRFSCCSGSGSVPASPTTGYAYGYDYPSTNNFYGQTGRRSSVDCGPFLRRLSSCSRDSGFFDSTNRRLSSCSSSSDSCPAPFRPRSNSSFVLMAHLPENVTRMPSGPDGTRGFGRLLSSHHVNTAPTPTIVSSCQ